LGRIFSEHKTFAYESTKCKAETTKGGLYKL